MPAKATCGTCGVVLSNQAAELCRPCWLAWKATQDGRPLCVDCGQHTSWLSGGKEKPLRCRPCEYTARATRQPRVGCVVPGCTGKHKARGYCKTHYLVAQATARQPWSGSRAYVAKLPCCLCGYDKMRSHVHRLGHVGGYEWGNCIPVCQRCHDEIISGITKEPAAGVEMPTGFTPAKPRPARTASNAARRGHIMPARGG